MTDSTVFYLKVTNPEEGTQAFLKDISQEFSTEYNEFWEKDSNTDVKLTYEPKNPENYSKVILVCAPKDTTINFIRYLLEKYISKIEWLNTFLNLTMKERKNAII